LFRFAISNAFRRKGIAIFAILGTALGIALMTVLISITDGMDIMMQEMMTDLAGSVAVYPADAPMGFMTGGGTPFSITYVEDINDIDHVKEVHPLVLVFIRREVANFGDPMGVTLRGVDLAEDAEMDGPTVNIIEGRTITPGENEIILGKIISTFGRTQGGEYADIGGTIVMPVSGAEPVELRVVGIFKTDSNIYDTFIYTDMVTARSLVGISGDEINFISVEADSTDNVEAVSDAIVALFEDEAVPVQAIIATEILENITETMGTFRSFLWIISLVAAIAGGVSIFIVMLISVIERTKEFGILKASGWSNRNIISSVVVQSITIGLLGAAVGLAIGYGGGQGIDAYIKMDIAIVTWRLVAMIGVFGIIAGVVGGLYPAMRAARVSPIESLRAL